MGKVVYSSTTILNLSSISLSLVEGVGESRRWGGSIYTWCILGSIGLTQRTLLFSMYTNLLEALELKALTLPLHRAGIPSTEPYLPALTISGPFEALPTDTFSYSIDLPYKAAGFLLIQLNRLYLLLSPSPSSLHPGPILLLPGAVFNFRPPPLLSQTIFRSKTSLLSCHFISSPTI